MDIKELLCRITGMKKNCKEIPEDVPPVTPNRSMLSFCREQGFPEVNIRKALIDLNGLNVVKLANGVAATTLYGTIKGRQDNQAAKEILAAALDVTVEELFRDRDKA